MKKLYSQWSVERDDAIQKVKSGKLALLKAVRATGAAQRSVIVNDNTVPPKENVEKREEKPTPKEKSGDAKRKKKRKEKTKLEPEPEMTRKEEPEIDEHDEGQRASNVADL